MNISQKFLRRAFRILSEARTEEALLNIVSKSGDPRFNQVVILAGGAGSGKGFALNNVLGITGKVFDVDTLKTGISSPTYSNQKLKADYQGRYGKEITDIDFKNSEDVSNLHQFVSGRKLDDKTINGFLAGQKTLKNKQNVIFDITLKDLKKLKKISGLVLDAGYELENIHIVWIMNDIEIAKEQNLCVPPRRCAAVDAGLPRQAGGQAALRGPGRGHGAVAGPCPRCHRPAQRLLLPR